jgi:murein DD-endopeptidase MepM/ murein hydrolase activator NlpD
VFESNNAAFAASANRAGIVFAKAMQDPLRQHQPVGWQDKFRNIDIVPDLGEDIGSLRWFRGLATLTIFSVVALAFLPDFGPVYGAQGSVPSKSELEEVRTQMITPLAYGADSGRRMAANENVVALGASPERPTIEINAVLGQGDGFARVLQRAGVGAGDASKALALVSSATEIGEIGSGTPIEIILGKRESRNAPRPLESLNFRARLDLQLAIARSGGGLKLQRKSIAVDDTPLRVRGTVGSSLYRSARAAGAPPEAIQSYLKVIAARTPLNRIGASDEFDIIIEHRRAETGEVKAGNLLYAGIDRGGKSLIQMLKWSSGDNTQWFEASGVGETKGAMSRPVSGPVSSNFGMRVHPVLGYRRMHSGMDFKAGYGTPIYSVTDGVIAYAGRKGGYGNFVQVNHGGGLATGYGHMSRIVASPGQRVRQGQIIGYVGSTGLSTGPHLHYEMYRNGKTVNPASVTFTQRAQLSGQDLARFRSLLGRLKSVKPGAALGPTGGRSTAQKQDSGREIDRIASVKRVKPLG